MNQGSRIMTTLFVLFYISHFALIVIFLRQALWELWKFCSNKYFQLEIHINFVEICIKFKTGHIRMRFQPSMPYNSVRSHQWTHKQVSLFYDLISAKCISMGWPNAASHLLFSPDKKSTCSASNETKRNLPKLIVWTQLQHVLPFHPPILQYSWNVNEL